MSEEVKSASETKKEDWMNSKWRPMMGWMYMVVCTCDFVVFPVLWSLLHAVLHTANMVQWNPLTLQGAGLFHIAMGAVLGIAAMGRTQEKMAGANNGGATTGFAGSTAAPSAPSTGFGAAPGGFGAATPAAPTSSFGSSSGFGATTPSATVTPMAATPLAAKKPVASKPIDDGNMPPMD